MAEIGNTAVWSQTDASNNTGTMPSWSGSASPNTIDDAGRAMMGAIAREWTWRNWTATAGGTADAKTLTYSVAPAAYYTGQRFAFIANTVNTGACTLNVNALGAKTIKKDVAGTLTDLSADDMPAGRYVEVAYNGTDMVWTNYGTVQDLSGYAALASANIFTNTQTIGKADTATNSVTDVLAIRHTTSGTAAAGFGTGFVYRLEDGGGTTTDAASIDAVWVDATDTSEDSKISFKTMVAGAAKAEAAYFGQGLVVGAATGGDQGAGTVNATALYINGVALTPYTNAVRATDSSITSNTTLASDSTLKFAMLANTAYDFEAWLLLDIDADSGWKLGTTGPASPTEVFIYAYYEDDNGTNRSSSQTSYAQLDSNTPGADRNGGIRIKGLIRNGANAGDFALQFAQATSHATAFVIKRGSRLSYRVNA